MKRLHRHVAFKSIAGIVLLLVLLSVIVGVIGYRSFTEVLLQQYASGAFLTAQTAAEMVNADRMDEYIQSGGTTPGYLMVWNRLDHLCNSSGSTFIYVIQPDRSDYGHITFLFSTIDHDSTYTKYDFGYVRNTTNDEYREKYRALYDQAAEQELVIREPYQLSAYGHGCKKVKKDRFVRQRFPDARIYTLFARQEQPGMEPPAADCRTGLQHRSKEPDQAFYLIEREEKQYLVSVSDAFLELRLLEQPQGSSFRLNGWSFIRYHYELGE